MSEDPGLSNSPTKVQQQPPATANNNTTADAEIATRKCWSRFSYVLGVLCVLCLAYALWRGPKKPFEYLPTLWQPLLVVFWLFSASFLIAWAERTATQFEEQALVLCRDRFNGEIWGRQVWWLRSPRIVAVTLPLVGIGFFVTYLLDMPWQWKLFRILVVCSCFYYASFGLWGSLVVYKSVSSFAQCVSSLGRLNLFHSDQLGGLGFAKDYADKGSIFVLSGVAVFPLGIVLAREAFSKETVVGYLIGSLAVLAIIAWTISTLLASLWGRQAISGIIERFRTPLLNQIAIEKKSLVESGNDSDLRRLELREKAALSLKTGIFTGMGGWKDLFTVAASIAAVWQILKDFLK